MDRRLVDGDELDVLGVRPGERQVRHADLDGSLVGRQTVRHRRERLDQGAHRAVGERPDEIALVVEVLVERAGAVAGAARDLAQREVGRAALEQDLASGGQDVVARLRMAPFVAPAATVGSLGAVV